MEKIKPLFPWHQGKQRRPYADNLAALESIRGEAEGVIYERTRGEKMTTHIICGGRGIRWQLATGPHCGYMEIIALGEGSFLNLTHMRNSMPLDFLRSKDSYLSAGITVDGFTAGRSILDSANYVAYLGAVKNSLFPSSTLRANNYVGSATLFMPFKKGEEMFGTEWPALRSAVSEVIGEATHQGHSIVTRPAPQFLLRFAHDLLNCPYSGDARYKFFKINKQMLLCHLNELFRLSRAAYLMPRPDRESIMRARQLIMADLSCPPMLDELAAQIGCGSDKLTRGFKAMYGCTVGQLVADERMKQAEGYLVQTDLEIKEIAGRLGYQSDSSFIRAFKARHGITPRKFRTL